MNSPQPPFDLKASALQTMLEHGFELDFSSQARDQLAQLTHPLPGSVTGHETRDLRNLFWSSIDNDSSRDLDQIEVAVPLEDGRTRIMIGIADVDVFVPKGSPIDDHAAQQATTVYAAVQTFPMLPNQLSTGTTSLLPEVDRLCIVVEFVVDTEGQIGESDVYRALLRNRAQLTYNAVGAWFEGSGPAPGRGAASGELQT
jgi:exoribonuclease-2